MSDYDYGQYDDTLPLFARASDPATSKIAAAEIETRASSLRAEFVRSLRARGLPSTAQEVAAGSDVAIRDSVRKRAAECVSAGAVVVIGSKRCEVTGKLATTYWVA